jgi:hypothetical protein
VTYSYDRVARTITPQDLKPWEADLRRMTKIYRTIPEATEEERSAVFSEARQLFGTFRQNFETWVYKTVLPPVQKDKPWAEEQVRRKAWDAIISLRDLFPTTWDYKGEAHIDAPWGVAQVIDKNIRRYQRAFGQAFDAIREYLESRSAPVERSETEHYDIAGMNVVIHGFGRGDEDLEKDLDDFLRHLGFFAKRIERTGFGKGLQGLNIEVSFADAKTLGSPNLDCGLYNPASDALTIYPLGFIGSDGGTFTHEVGHRYWFRVLSNNARAHWTEVMAAQMTEITKADVDEFTDKYLAKHPDLYRTDLVALVNRTEDDAERKAKFKELAEGSRPIDVENGDTEKLRDVLTKYVGDKVHIEDISDYARTNPTEAFADAFRFYVLKGPNALGPWTRVFFERIVWGGKMAHRIVARYLGLG